eukprot:scaffold5206_cov154-Isochrysis_galbana.AAC.4
MGEASVRARMCEVYIAYIAYTGTRRLYILAEVACVSLVRFMFVVCAAAPCVYYGHQNLYYAVVPRATRILRHAYA